MIVSKNIAIIAIGYLLLNVNIYAMDITQRLKSSLSAQYHLDQTSLDSIVAKLKPFIENHEHDAMLESFIDLSAQHSKKSSSISGEEPLPADDAVVVAPEYHEVLAENNMVRVLWGVSEAGDQEPLHRHHWESILLILEGATFEIDYADGSQERDYYPSGVYALPADTQAAAYKNLDARCSFLRFEMKGG